MPQNRFCLKTELNSIWFSDRSLLLDSLLSGPFRLKFFVGEKREDLSSHASSLTTCNLLYYLPGKLMYDMIGRQFQRFAQYELHQEERAFFLIKLVLSETLKLSTNPVQSCHCLINSPPDLSSLCMSILIWAISFFLLLMFMIGLVPETKTSKDVERILFLLRRDLSFHVFVARLCWLITVLALPRKGRSFLFRKTEQTHRYTLFLAINQNTCAQ